MSNLVIADKTQLINVADAIREKVGFSGTLNFPDDFTDKLDDIIDAWSIVTGTIKSFSDENITSIGNYAFSNCKKLKNVNIPSVTKLGKSCFANCRLTEINLPLVTTIDETASGIFSNNNYMITVNMPNLTNTTDNMFSYNSFRHISLPSVTKLGANTFAGCSVLSSVDLPLVTEVGNHAFYSCRALQSIDLPSATSIGEWAFSYCDAIENITAPNVVTIGTVAFHRCSSLTYLNFPKVITIENGIISECGKLEVVDFASATTIKSNALKNNPLLNKVALRSDTLCTLENKNAFDYTPFASGRTGGTVYVPANLVEAYKTATNWSTLYAAGTCNFSPIEGMLDTLKEENMVRNNIKQINVKYYPPIENEYEPIVTVVSSNDNIASISNITVTDNDIIFNVEAHNVDGEATITVTLAFGDAIFTQSASFKVAENLPPCSYSVESVDGATYGFALNDAGYYESQNKGVNSSYAICKVNFYSNGIDSMKLKCINSGENFSDFGILSNVDTTLTLSYTVDSANVFKSFRGLSSTTEQIVDYGVVEEGEHFIYIKYRKDGSARDGNDSLQFFVEFME
jgi:hypothetical protein